MRWSVNRPHFTTCQEEWTWCPCIFIDTNLVNLCLVRDSVLTLVDSDELAGIFHNLILISWEVRANLVLLCVRSRCWWVNRINSHVNKVTHDFLSRMSVISISSNVARQFLHFRNEKPTPTLNPPIWWAANVSAKNKSNDPVTLICCSFTWITDPLI